MNKKFIFKKSIMSVLLVTILIATSVISLTACSEKIVYDAGEYGQVTYSSSGTGSVEGVKCKEGYRFLGWSEPIKEGRKKIYKAQYEYKEYYLSEYKEVYEIAQGVQQSGPSIMYKITNMQTNVQEEKILSLYSTKVEYSESGMTNGNGERFQSNIRPYEFDVIAKVTIDDSVYNLYEEYSIHFVRNRIPVESIIVEAWSSEGQNVVSVDDSCRFKVISTPDDASYQECEYKILSIVRDGFDLDENLIKEIAYISYRDLYVTDKAQNGDLIYVKVYNKRDPEVESEVIEIMVY